MIDTSRLTIRSIRGDGIESRWSGDAADARNVFAGLSITTAMPGGFKTLICQLPRAIVGDDFDLNPFDLVVVEGPGGEVVFEGRQADLPRSSGADSVIEVNAVGRSSELLYDPTFREVYVDRGFDSWTEPAQSRVATLKAAGNPLGTDVTVQARTRSLHFEGPTRKEVEIGSTAEAWYRMPVSCKAARMEYSMAEGFNGSYDNGELFVTSDLSAVGTSYGLTVGNDQIRAITTPERYLMLRLRCNSTHTKAVGNTPYRTYKELAVYGDHGLPGVDTGTGQTGVLASDVVKNVLDRAAPLLAYTAESIEATDFPIPHLVFAEPTTPEQVILAVNAYHLWDWGVYEDGVFFFRPIDAYPRRWAIRLDDGGEIEDAGPQSESVVNGVIVSFTDENDEQRTAGPPGSGSDYEDVALAITDLANPVNAHGIPIKYEILEVSAKTTQLGALQLGARRVAELELTPYRGSFTAVGSIVDLDSLIEWPAWMARAGDSITLLSPDTDDPIGDEHRIIETDFDYDSLTNTLTVDDSPFRLSALIERLEAVTR